MRGAAGAVLLVAGAAGAVLLVAGAAGAQTATVPHQPNFSVERLTPPVGPAAGFQVEDAEVGAGLGLVTSVSSAPLVVRAVQGGGTLSTPVAWRLGVDLLGATMWKG